MARILALILLLGMLVSPGCSRPQAGGEVTGVEVGMKTAPAPPRVGENALEIELTGAKARSLSVEANMSHPGMTPVSANLTSQDGTRWQAPLKLTMAGDWFVIVRAELEDGRKLERQIPLPGVVSSP